MNTSPPLPIPLTPLIGRDRELAEVMDLLLDSSVRLVTLTGPGGVGKTRLGLEVARRLSVHFPDGVWLVRLDAIRDVNLVLATIAQVVGIAESTAEDLADRVAGWLGQGQHLFLIDNFEQVAEASPVLHRLLESCPGLKMLVTSRMSLALTGEREYLVEPLVVPSPNDPIEHVRSFAAIRMFEERAIAVQPSFRIDAANQNDIVEICRRLDGLPLAIELAAARIKVQTPAALRERLTRQLRVLRGGARTLPDRQKTMRDTIAWSYDLLEPASAAVFRATGAFVGGFSLPALRAVLADDDEIGIDEDDLIELLSVLVDQSLVRRINLELTESRFDLFQTIAEFAQDALIEAGEDKRRRRAHAEWVISFIDMASPLLIGSDQAEWQDRLEIEHDNIRSALQFALDSSDYDLAMRIPGKLWRFWWLRGHLIEGSRWYDQVLDGYTGSDSLPFAHTLRGAGAVAEDLGEPEKARDYLQQAHAVASSVGERQLQAEILVQLGTLAADTGNYDEAVGNYAKALLIFEDLGDQRGQLSVVANRASVDFYRGQLEEAMAGYKLAREISLEVGDHRSATMLLGNMGAIYNEQGNFAEALVTHLNVADEYRATGDETGLIFALNNAASCAIELGDLDNASVWSNSALEIADRMGLRRLVGFCQATLGHIASERGQTLSAAEWNQRSLETFRLAGDLSSCADTVVSLAELALDTHNLEACFNLYGAAMAIRASLEIEESPLSIDVREHNFARLDLEVGEETRLIALERGGALSLDEITQVVRDLVGAISEAPEDPVDAKLIASTGLSKSDLALLRSFLSRQSHAEIAEDLGVSQAIVVNRIGQLYTRTGTNSRASLTAWAFKSGVV